MVSGLLLAAIWVAALPWGCTLFKEKVELSAEENYNRGMEKFEQGDYSEAIPYFRKILENYPFSIYAISSELKIAESHFYGGKYVEALVHLQGFKELHPTNEHIPYVIWMKANCYFQQFSTIDRDVSALRHARLELEELQRRFPGSLHAENADVLITKVLRGLARQDFYVARFYYRDGEFQAALSRLHALLEDHRSQEITDRAIYYIGKNHYFLRNRQPALDAFRTLLRLHPDSRYVPRSRSFVRDLERGDFRYASRYHRFKERTLGYLGYE